jgi:hypothetical protein
MFKDGMVGDAADVELIVGLLVTKGGWNRPHVQAGKIGFAALREPRSTSSKWRTNPPTRPVEAARREIRPPKEAGVLRSG